MKAMKTADMRFSQYIRLKHSIGNGNDRYCRCVTCGNIKPIKQVDCGHWIGRENKGTRYMEANCRPQCKHCNYFKGGRQHDFEQALIKELGVSEVNMIRLAANQTKKLSSFDYEVITDEYREKVKLLQKELGCNLF